MKVPVNPSLLSQRLAVKAARAASGLKHAHVKPAAAAVRAATAALKAR